MAEKQDKPTASGEEEDGPALKAPSVTVFSVKVGWLERQSSFLKRWKKAWFVLSNDAGTPMLAWYKSPKEVIPIEMVPMKGCAVLPAERRFGRPNTFEVRTNYGNYALCAESKAEMLMWIKAIKGAIKRVGVKVIVVGQSGVGKTSFLRYWYRNEWEPGQASSDEHCFFRKDVSFESWLCRLGVWDVSGRPEVRELAPICYSSPSFDEPAHVALLCYDITNRASFDDIASWHQEIIARCPRILFVVLGMKRDLESKRAVTAAEVSKYAESIGAATFECNSTTGEGVNEVFDAFLQQLHDSNKFVDMPMMVAGV